MEMKINYSTFYSLFVLVITMIGMNGCQSSNNKTLTTPTTGHIRISADETFKPVLDAEIQVFEALYPYADIEVVYKTETEALNDLLKDSTNLIISSRKLQKPETEYFNAKNLFPKELSIAKDGIALIVNRENTDTLLNLETIKGILTGKINNWKQINPKSSLGNLRMVFDNKNSSTVRFIIDSLCKDQQLCC
jgi:phosphate transport system substrate-binding protein